ncbi:MAG: hypothetical protein FJ143_17510, partial [Deltaproteobacteria bacterium]|nr:hypothetical protein [Deltaproteobacteria bacterium]
MTGQNAAVCSQCQVSNSADALYCDECGAPLDARCLRCGEANRPNAKFCKKCGNGLAADARSETTSSVHRQPPPGENPRPGEAAGLFLASERKQVTVMFADIRGSTAFIEKLDPEEVRRHFDPLLKAMMDAVHRYGGTVNQVLGDGIMALFGAPQSREDHATRACYAALAMQEEMRRDAARGDALRVGIGLNSGEVVVRSLANDLNFDYSALGQTTHLAARMQELAKPGTILMTSACAREVEGFVQLKPLGQRQAKGVSQPLEVFELAGATAARTRLQVAARRGLTPFVGREHEIESFHRLAQKVADGGGQILAMAGEAGMGKSRLVRELCDNHLPAGWRIVAGSAISFGKATPYFPVIELLRRYFALAEDDSREAMQAKVVQSMRQLDSALSDLVAPILTL